MSSPTQPQPQIPSQDSPPQPPPSQPQSPPSPPLAIPTQNPPPPPSQPPQPPSPPPSSPPPPPPPPIIQALSYSPLKKPQPIPWSHEETLNLIKAYREKWYSLKRGQLKASQWEEVAITIAARCGLDEPSKSGTQCRHKIEKLRKRYRAEKQKLPPNFNYHHHPWIYFSLMDQLERGPMPISAVAPTIPKNEDSNLGENSDDDDDEDEDGVDLRFASLRKLKGENSNSRDFEKRVDGFFRIGRSNLGDFGNGFGKRSDFEGGNFRDLKKRKNYYEGEDNEGEEEEEDEEEIGDERGRKKRSNLMGDLAAEIRGFAEKFVRIEKKKLDLMRENERFRNEMENKRMEMIYLSQQRTVELINKAFDVGGSSSSSSAHKKMKLNSEL